MNPTKGKRARSVEDHFLVVYLGAKDIFLDLTETIIMHSKTILALRSLITSENVKYCW